MTGFQAAPGWMEDLLWCLLNPVYGLARLQEILASTSLPLMGCLLLFAALLAIFQRRR